MPKVLKYFDLNFLGEAIRYILHYTDQEFEDVRYEFNVKTWPVKELKDSWPFGKVPILEDGDKVLYQSIAIARYVSAGTDLLPSDPWEQAVLDAIVHTIYDFSNKFNDYIEAETLERKAKLLKDLKDLHIGYYFSRFEKILQENNGFFNGKLSWADFVLVAIIETTNLFLDEEVQKGYPAITKLMVTVNELPRVKEYIKTRPTYKKFSFC